VVRFYNKRGTAEQWIKEGKQAVKMTRLSCHRSHSNQVRLALSLLAYILGICGGIWVCREGLRTGRSRAYGPPLPHLPLTPTPQTDSPAKLTAIFLSRRKREQAVRPTSPRTAAVSDVLPPVIARSNAHASPAPSGLHQALQMAQFRLCWFGVPHRRKGDPDEKCFTLTPTEMWGTMAAVCWRQKRDPI
jgi:hypothetical protein